MKSRLQIVYRILAIVVFFILCYHLDFFTEAFLENTTFFVVEEVAEDAGWWDKIVGKIKSAVFETIGDLVKWLIVLASKLFWPFLFAAIAIPLALPRQIKARNRWSAALTTILTIISIIVLVYIEDDLSALWQAIKDLRFSDSKVQGERLATELKWAMVLFAINATVLYTFLYRILHKYKLEQLLYFFVLIVNAVYIVMLDPIPGEVDDVVGIVITAFLSMALFFDRMLTKEHET